MIRFDEINEEILYTRDSVTRIDLADVEYLKALSRNTRRKRIRLCAHPDVSDALHEMLIVHHAGNYVPPHKHPGKSESFHMIEGILNIVLFEDDGSIRDVFRMDASGKEGFFYYRLSEPLYHTVIAVSDVVVFHETTNGPFRREDMVIPRWAPGDSADEEVIRAYMSQLHSSLEGRKAC